MQKINDPKTIGILVFEERKKQNITQEQLAALCGVGIRFLRELEHGKETCHINKVMLTLKALGINVFAAHRNEDIP